MTKLDLNDAVMSPYALMDWYMNYRDSLDEAGRERLRKRLDMDNYDPREMEPAVLKKRLEEQLKESDPNGPYMKSLFKDIDEEFEWQETPWWKRMLVRVGALKRKA